MRGSRNDSCAGPDRNTDDRTDSHADIDPRANANSGPDSNPNDRANSGPDGNPNDRANSRANIHSRPNIYSCANTLTDPYRNPNTDP